MVSELHAVMVGFYNATRAAHVECPRERQLYDDSLYYIYSPSITTTPADQHRCLPYNYFVIVESVCLRRL